MRKRNEETERGVGERCWIRIRNGKTATFSGIPKEGGRQRTKDGGGETRERIIPRLNTGGGKLKVQEKKKPGCSLSMLKTGHRNLGKEKTSDRMIQRNENLIQSGANRYLHCVKMMFLCVFFFF